MADRITEPAHERPHIPTQPATPAAMSSASLVAAAAQFSALARFGAASADPISPAERARLDAERKRALREAFLTKAVFEINAHGAYADDVKYAHAVSVIQAKAFALGYGAQSYAAPIVAVPGGYVGRYGGNDIYAAAP